VSSEVRGEKKISMSRIISDHLEKQRTV
jgi:hypothetical protein